MKLKNLCCAWWLCLLPTLLFAQVDKEYQEYVKQMQKEYNNYVDEQNKEFAKFLKETWEAYDLMRQVPRPVRPEPVKPTVFDTTKPPAKPIRIKIEEVPKPVPVIPVRSKPVPNISSPQPGEVEVIIPDKPVKPRVGKNYTTLQFYNVPYAVSHALKNKLHLKEISEKAVSEGWETLAGGNYQTLIEDCMVAKAEMTLSDYGFLMLTRQVATELCGDDSPNEVAFMQMFILCQAGFKSKVARVDNRLVLLYATDETIYGVNSITIDGTKYYLQASPDNRTGKSIYTYRRDFSDKGKALQMHIDTAQLYEGVNARMGIRFASFRSKAYPEMEVGLEVSTNLMNYYNDYASCELLVYAQAPPSGLLGRDLLQQLEKPLAGKNRLEAANMLLNFVQTAFEYKTDGEQFGRERPLFIDEIFYYPYCDCEDRSFLFAYLVRNLLKLDVVLLDYPNHIATAVCFDVPVDGDYLTIDGKKYIVCDPTFINASVGRCMPDYKNVAAKVLR